MQKAGRIDSHPELGIEKKILLLLTQRFANQVLQRKCVKFNRGTGVSISRIMCVSVCICVCTCTCTHMFTQVLGERGALC